MSQETRAALVNSGKLVFQRDSQKTDLLNEYKTNTWLVQFLIDLTNNCPYPILITALNSDHSPGTWHNPPGRAVDCWHANWAEVGDDEILKVLQAAGKVAANGAPTLIEVGLSGDAAKYQTYVTWPESAAVFVESWGQDNEHVHFAVGAPT